VHGFRWHCQLLPFRDLMYGLLLAIHSVSFSTQQALQVYEEAILPDVLFNGGKENYRGIINCLDAMNTVMISQLSRRYEGQSTTICSS